MKWIKGLMLTVGVVATTAGAAHGAALTGTFTMRSPGGGTVGTFADVTGAIGGGTFSVASPSPFFGVAWTAHDGTTFGPGTYTIDTIQTGVYTNLVVGAGQVGGHILFDYGPTKDIDVLLVWDVDVMGGVKTYTAGDPSVGATGISPAMAAQPDGIIGTPMIDGAFPAWNAAFDLVVTACGDGVVDTGYAGETDEECDDGNVSNTDACLNTCVAASCGDGFAQAGVEDCDGDGAGTGGETATCDVDCTAVSCGDGVTNATAGEACDDGGESATCDVDCTAVSCGDGVTNATAGEACDDGNGSNTDACLTTCVAATCGDGFIRAGVEACDDGNLIDGDGCSSACQNEACGNGIVDGSEECDGDGAGTGGETATCDLNCTFASCGDGTTNATAGEACDDAGESATCDVDCTAVTCGDGVPNATAGEACDDGNANNTDACLNTCVAAGCGDGYVRAGVEACDGDGAGAGGETTTCDVDCTAVSCGDGVTNATAGEACDDAGESATCDADCTVASCGDGVTNATAGEACDDGNMASGDGCNATCTSDETCGNGFTDPGEACDDGNADNTDACLDTCVAASCGDGFVEAGVEQCDDANADNTDACPDTCMAASCGDGFVEAGVEVCDDGNADNTDACLDTCVAASCGDGFVEAGVEQCDDGNTDETDGCLATCETDGDFDRVGDAADACDGGGGFAGPFPDGTLMAFDSGVQPGGPGSPVTSGSYFQMGADGDPNATQVAIGLGPDGGIIVGQVQPASGSHSGNPNDAGMWCGNTVTVCSSDADCAALVPACDLGTHICNNKTTSCASAADCPAVNTCSIVQAPGLDQPWGFFNSTGMHFTVVGVTDNGDGTLDFSGWRVTWNGIPAINMGAGAPATVTLDGDRFVVDYATIVPQGDPSGFGGVPYRVHLEGVFELPGGLPGDQDADGVADELDNCPNVVNPGQANGDGDDVGDACDACPIDFYNDLDQDCLCADTVDIPPLPGFDPDNDGDGILNADDPTPNDTTDTDGDGLINNIDPDDDNDGILDADDANPLVFDDFDGDGIGDGFDPDDDNDGVADVDDAFPFNAFDSADADADGSGDIADACDNVPAGAAVQAAALVHASAVGDPLSDGTLLTINPGSASCSATDPSTGSCFYMEVATGIYTITGLKPGEDGGVLLGAAQDHPTFADQLAGVPAGIDAVWNFFSNTGNTFTSGDGVGATTLSDGVTEALSFRTWTIFWNNKVIPLTKGLDDIADNDDDLAAIVTSADGLDPFTANYFKENADGTYELVYNSLVPTDCGCGFEAVHYTAFLRGRVVRPGVVADSDGDFVADNQDNCPQVANTDQADGDGDGTGDVCDVCPSDPFDDADGDCLCANPEDPEGAFGFDDDNDGDGVLNVDDAFPDDPTETVDSDGDGIGDNADTDDDGDCIPDVIDSSPLNPDLPIDADGDCVPAAYDADDANAFVQVDRDGDGIDDVQPRDASGNPVSPPSGTLLAGGVVIGANGGRVAVDGARVTQLAEAAVEVGDGASRALARAAARLQGTAVDVPAGTTIGGVDADGDGVDDEWVVIGIGLADGEGSHLSVALPAGGTLETTVVGLPVVLTPEGATFDPFALVTLVYSLFDIPTGVIDQGSFGVVRTDADGTMTLFGDCDDTVDRNGDEAVDEQDLDVDCIAARDTSAHTITVRTSHFSTFAVTTGDTDGDGLADDLDPAPTVPEAVAGDSHNLDDRALFSVVNKNSKDAFGCAASPSGGRAPWSALAVLLIPLGILTALRRRRSWMRHLPWIVTLVTLGLAAAPALATTTLYPTGFGAKMAAMGGAGNAAGDDATAVATNPANLTKIDGWRVDLDVGALISNVSYSDGEVNTFAGGRFEINEGTLYFLPTVGIARKMGRLGVGFGMWGQGGGGLIYQNFGFNDVSPVEMGGGRRIYMTNGFDLTGEEPLTAENAIREDNYTLMIIGRFGLAFSYDLTDDLTVAVEPLQDYGFLKFGIFGSIEMAPHGVQARHIGANDPGNSSSDLGIDGIIARNSKASDPNTTDGIITRREAKIALGLAPTAGVPISDENLASLKERFDYTVEEGTNNRITTTVAGGQAFRRFLDPDTTAAAFPVNETDSPQKQQWATHQQEVAQNTAQGFPTHGQLFAGRTFNQFILDREGPTSAADDQWMVTYDGHGDVVELPVDGVQRIADFFRQPTAGQTASNTPSLFRKRIWNFELYDDPNTGEQRGRTATNGDPINEHADINQTLNAVTRSLMAQPFYDSTQFTDAEHDYVVDEFFGLFQDVFPDFGFGMGEVSAFASGRGFEDFSNAVKVGARWQVAPWLSIGGSYTSQSSLIMRDGGIKMDFTNQIQQGLDVGMRMLVTMNTLFDELGMTQFAEFIDTVADGVATDPAIQNVDFAVAPGSDPTVTSSQQIFNELPKLGDVERLLNEAPSFGDATHGPGTPTNPGSDRAIPTNQQLDLTLTGSSGRPEDNFTGDDAHSVEMLTRSAAGLFRTFSSLMGYVENQQFQNVTSQPNYEIPKRLNDPTNNTATLGINSGAGTFHNGSGTIVPSAERDQEVVDYYRDIARFLRGFGVASIANPDGDAATQAMAVAQVQGILDPANYATPEEFLTAYDALRSQFAVAGTFRSDIRIVMPQQAEVGIEVKPLPRLRLTSDVKWIDYSDTFQRFSATLSNTDNEVFQRFLGLSPQGDQLDFGQASDFTFKEELNWHDQWVFNFGTAYDLLDNFTVMAGYSFTGRRFNDLWNNFGEAQSAMDDNNNMALLPAFGYQTGSLGFSYRWNNKEISLALERAFTTTMFSGSQNQANSQYRNSTESANQDTVHVQYSLAF